MRDDAGYQDEFFDNDIVAVWASIADGLYESLDYLRVAKARGCKTVLVLFDDWGRMQHEILTDYDL